MIHYVGERNEVHAKFDVLNQGGMNQSETRHIWERVHTALASECMAYQWTTWLVRTCEPTKIDDPFFDAIRYCAVAYRVPVWSRIAVIQPVGGYDGTTFHAEPIQDLRVFGLPARGCVYQSILYLLNPSDAVREIIQAFVGNDRERRGEQGRHVYV